MSEIDSKALYSISYYEYGEAYYGSSGPIRYRVAREPLQNVHFIPADKRGDCTLRAVVWPEPFSYAATDEEKKKTKDFDFSQDGLLAAVKWLNEMLHEAESEEEEG